MFSEKGTNWSGISSFECMLHRLRPSLLSEEIIQLEDKCRTCEPVLSRSLSAFATVYLRRRIIFKIHVPCDNNNSTSNGTNLLSTLRTSANTCVACVFLLCDTHWQLSGPSGTVLYLLKTSNKIVYRLCACEWPDVTTNDFEIIHAELVSVIRQTQTQRPIAKNVWFYWII